ncbi:MAG: chemotaxis protein CheX [Candidatus Omnitrophica bacterium]|nr:chemotaxis protein CheX [Candidatus Omnitrophota bacterium]
MTAKNKFDQQVIATTLMGCVQETFRTMCHIEFEEQPDFQEKEIIEYNSRMRAFGLEKFEGPCYVSIIYFYLNQKDFKAERANGALALFIEDSISQTLLHSLGHRSLNEDDKSIVMDTCGEFANVVAGQFKNELQNFGYVDVIISAPKTYINDVPEGINFNFDELKYYEMCFYLKKTKALVIDITMGPVPLKA